MSELTELANARIFRHMGHHSASIGGSTCVCGADMRSEAGQRMCPKAEYIHIDVHRSEMQKLVNNFGNIKSGAKIRKKVNQVYGRQLTDLGRDAKKELDQEIARRLANFNENLVKPKPRYVPTWLWRIILDIVLKSDTMV